jgi:flagellum-specific ATP synthase
VTLMVEFQLNSKNYEKNSSMNDLYENQLNSIRTSLSDFYPYKVYGQVNQVVGLVIEGKGPISSVGDAALIFPIDGTEPIDAEVVGFKDGKTLLMPLGDLRGVGIGSKIVSKKQAVNTTVGDGLLGRVIDGLGNPMDGKGPIDCQELIPIYRDTINPMNKKRITEPLDLGIRSLNGLLTCGKDRE